MFVITYHYIGHLASAGKQQGHLALYLMRNGRYLAGQFMGNDFMTGYSSAVNILETFQLAGFEAAYFSKYSIYN